jgi:hypothetical protein
MILGGTECGQLLLYGNTGQVASRYQVNFNDITGSQVAERAIIGTRCQDYRNSFQCCKEHSCDLLYR